MVRKLVLILIAMTATVLAFVPLSSTPASALAPVRGGFADLTCRQADGAVTVTWTFYDDRGRALSANTLRCSGTNTRRSLPGRPLREAASYSRTIVVTQNGRTRECSSARVRNLRPVLIDVGRCQLNSVVFRLVSVAK